VRGCHAAVLPAEEEEEQETTAAAITAAILPADINSTRETLDEGAQYLQRDVLLVAFLMFACCSCVI